VLGYIQGAITSPVPLSAGMLLLVEEVFDSRHIQNLRQQFTKQTVLCGQFSVKTPTPVHPLLKVGKPFQNWFIFSLQDVPERKKYKNGKKNSMKLVR
jgi:hypothetical protein